jgi:hypothetical protein
MRAPASFALAALCLSFAAAACTGDAEVVSGYEDDGSTAGVSIIARGLTGCNGKASAAIPSDGRYVMTTFGGPGDHQSMSCGGYADGTWYYAASRQRYGCGAHLQVEANGVCVVVEADDYGPDVCVEDAAGMPILDASPVVAQALFGESGLGYSDHQTVTVTEVAASTPLGPCEGDPGDPPPTDPVTCASATLGRDVAEGTCVQAASDALWYACEAGAWNEIPSSAGCTDAYGWCDSATLGVAVPPRTCVQAASNALWYQCNGQAWVRPVDTAAETGPIGACSSVHPL